MLDYFVNIDTEVDLFIYDLTVCLVKYCVNIDLYLSLTLFRFCDYAVIYPCLEIYAVHSGRNLKCSW